MPTQNINDDSRLGLTPGQALVLAGFIPSRDPNAAEKTALNRIQRHDYPFPLIDLAGLGFKRRWIVRRADIEATLAMLAGRLQPQHSAVRSGNWSEKTPQKIKRRGRPRNNPRGLSRGAE